MKHKFKKQLAKAAKKASATEKKEFTSPVFHEAFVAINNKIMLIFNKASLQSRQEAVEATLSVKPQED